MERGEQSGCSAALTASQIAVDWLAAAPRPSSVLTGFKRASHMCYRRPNARGICAQPGLRRSRATRTRRRLPP
eukprot:352579-Chlamydomonas_euryale.AAC.3